MPPNLLTPPAEPIAAETHAHGKQEHNDNSTGFGQQSCQQQS